MTEHDMAVRFDRALDGERDIALNGSEPLLGTAETVQSLFDRQHAFPSEEFIAQLERSLFPLSIVPSAAEGLRVAAVSRPQVMARPTPVAPKVRGLSQSRLAAIVAAFFLLIGGGV